MVLPKCLPQYASRKMLERDHDAPDSRQFLDIVSIGVVTASSCWYRDTPHLREYEPTPFALPLTRKYASLEVEAVYCLVVDVLVSWCSCGLFKHFVTTNGPQR